MKHSEKWIWLPKSSYPENQTTVYSGFDETSENQYCVAEFKRKYFFDQEVVSAKLRFSGDTLFQLFCNGNIVATGPAAVGGDFIGNEEPRDNFYSFEKSIQLQTKTLDLFARVQMAPTQICDYSTGHGGFMLFGVLTFEDGTQEVICTDETWKVRKNGAYRSPRFFDGRIKPDNFVSAEMTRNIWHTDTAIIPPRTEKVIIPNGGDITLLPKEEKEIVAELDMIYAGFLHIKTKTEGELFAEITCRELQEKNEPESFIFKGEEEYRGFRLHSVGNLLIKLKNESDRLSRITVSLIATHYPTPEEAETVTCDGELNQVLEVCKHTLKYCRQTHHLDSPRHCEPMACTGDYYIESLMTMFSFGDMRLAEFDLLRTAEMLLRHVGRMFHTTYSLIWVKMLYDVYMTAGHRELIEKCKPALLLLLKRFESYIGQNGLIETPPDYMFVDWIYIDKISMHHPPKALGQTCLNMFYFGALDTAEKIFGELALNAEAERCREKKEDLRNAVNSLLFDAEKGIYFEGLNTPTAQSQLNSWLPQNVDKRYCLKQSNILAAYVGICDEGRAKELIAKIMSDEIKGDYQPYFAHYLLEAIYKYGLRDSYTLQVIQRWKAPVKECSKGLVEGFVPPEPSYSFDHSHAWGGTPLYSLPKALLGLEILKPGMCEISLTPSLLGLNEARSELLTPFGKVICELNKDKPPIIQHPKEVSVILNESRL